MLRCNKWTPIEGFGQRRDLESYIDESLLGRFKLASHSIWRYTSLQIFVMSFSLRRMIFLVEGAFTIVLAIIAGAFLTPSVARAKFLTPDEKRVSLFVMGRDLSAAAASKLEKDLKSEGSYDDKSEAERKAIATTQVIENEGLEWFEVKRGLKSIMAWNTGIAYLCILNSWVLDSRKEIKEQRLHSSSSRWPDLIFSIVDSLYSFTLFLPTILGPLFDTADQSRIQLLTVPPFVPATIVTIIVAIAADRLKSRGVFILCLLPISIIGYIILIASHNNEARYAAVFMLSFGIYASVPCILSILPNNFPNPTSRATVTALNLMVANCAGECIIRQTGWNKTWWCRYSLPSSTYTLFSSLSLSPSLSLFQDLSPLSCTTLNSDLISWFHTQ